MPQQIRFIGKHRTVYEQDISTWELHGEISLAEAKELTAQSRPAGERGYSMLLINAHDCPSVSPEVRRYLADYSRAYSIPSCTVIIGASAVVRTVSILLTNALRLLTRPVAGGLFFVKSESEARAIFDDQRRSLQQAAARRRESVQSP